MAQRARVRRIGAPARCTDPFTDSAWWLTAKAPTDAFRYAERDLFKRAVPSAMDSKFDGKTRSASLITEERKDGVSSHPSRPWRARRSNTGAVEHLEVSFFPKAFKKHVSIGSSRQTPTVYLEMPMTGREHDTGGSRDRDSAVYSVSGRRPIASVVTDRKNTDL